MIDISKDVFHDVLDHNKLICKLETALAARPRVLGGSVPHAFVATLGGDLLHASPGDLGAMRIRWDSKATAKLAATTASTAMNGALHINVMLLAAILGRRDLVERFHERGRFSLEAGLQWLVLHGVCEHRLWHFVDGPLRTALLRPVVNAFQTLIPALGALVLRERPEWKRRFIKNGNWQAEAFRHWLREDGFDTYRLFWLASEDDLGGWSMRDWQKREPSQSTDSSQFSIQDTQKIGQIVNGAIEEHPSRVDVWHAENRSDTLTEMRPSSVSAQMLVNSPAVPSKNGWLTLTSGRFTIPVPTRSRHTPFVMVEMSIADGEGDLIGAASLNGQALPVLLHRAGHNCCLIIRLPKLADGGRLALLHVEFLTGEGRPATIELIRIWNL